MSTAPSPTSGTATTANAPTALVEPSWLSAHLTDGTVRVVEVDVSTASYADGHIPGAVLWDVYQDLKDADYATVGPEAFAALLGRSGIGPGTTVVLYGYAPALAFWLLTLHGHADARILNRSRQAWLAAGLPWTTEPSVAPATTYPTGHRDVSIRADRGSVAAAIGRPHTTLVDVRTEAEFRGERFWPSGGMEPNGRAGHVPSAVHQLFDDVTDEQGAFRPPAELRSLLAGSDVDVEADDELITYCTIGGRAATAWFVLTHLLGRQGVRVYDGSWAEWGRTADAPVASA
jgi:thiosulfate/3-mercaptopyruvate sulfurtransferase